VPIPLLAPTEIDSANISLEWSARKLRLRV